jgi:hypothetical protein
MQQPLWAAGGAQIGSHAGEAPILIQKITIRAARKQNIKRMQCM